MFYSLVQFKLEKKKVMLDGHTNKPLIKVEGEKENKNIRRKARQLWIFFILMCWVQKHMLSQVIFPLHGDIKMEQTQVK